MKRRILLSIVVCVCFLAVGSTAFGQKAHPKTPKAKAAPSFDAKLAARVGADELGMRNFVLCILKTGPNDAQIVDEKKRGEIFAGHFANMKRLAAEGKLLVAGPFGKNDRGYRGIFVLNVTTAEEAQALVETDPVVSSGIMTPELTPLYASAALLLVNDLHSKIAKKNL
ncbi:MAG: hypothetical protein KF736_07300 [Acidobacteria bacterium]|nr:hypothetical protein [Acidobacteriota bacterium]MCW5950529.1 hypothetical protein [Pyrinomonadaceae bacterium]